MSFYRGRRLRSTKGIRDLVSDITLSKKDIVYPLFLEEGSGIKKEIESMPSQYRWSLDMIEDEIKEILSLGIRSVLLFGIPASKDSCGSESYNKNGIIQEGIKKIKSISKDITIITDVCMCEYTDHGHCGIIKDGHVDNDTTIPILSQIALSHVEAGADIVAPSDMMDGRVASIRATLDSNGYVNTPIMSYSVKYASAFYGPFREAADSAPTFGNRHEYQMSFKNSWEIENEVEADIDEGCDILIVKPALAYLDVISRVSSKYNIPVAGYCVSGEYSMVKAASENGWVDEKSIVLEKMYSLKRAGASIIITYHGKDIARWIDEDKE